MKKGKRIVIIVLAIVVFTGCSTDPAVSETLEASGGAVSEKAVSGDAAGESVSDRSSQDRETTAPLVREGGRDANDDNRYERDRYGDALIQRDHKGKIVKTIPMAIDEVEWVTNEWLYYTSGYDGGLWRMPIEKTKKGDSLKKKKKEKLLEEYDIDIHYATSSYLLMEIWKDQDEEGILCKYDLESGNLIVEGKKVSGDKD